jgi:hypothetical protein
MAQFNSANGAFQRQARTLFETNLLASSNGVVISNTNPLPVTLGGANVTFTGPVTIPANVEISNDVGNPIGVIGTTTNPNGKLVLTVDDDTVQHTSRNRRKVSTQEVLFFNTFQYDRDLEVWDESFTANSTFANATFELYEGGVILEVSNTINSEVIRQTKNVIRYVPGRQNELIMTTRFNGTSSGVRKRIGAFDANNGVYFEDDGGTYSCVIRRATANGNVETRFTRDNWNYDKMDGTGPSGITLDFNKNQMITIEYEWFGAGQVEWNFIVDNYKHPIHQYNTGNRQNIVWSNTPFVPHRFELTNTAGALGTHKLFQGGFAVLTEGTVGPLGRRRDIASPITGKTLTTANVYYPVLSIRLLSAGLGGVVLPIAFQAATLDNTSIFYRIIRDATLTSPSWVVEENTLIEYDLSATAVSGGDIIASGYISPASQGGEELLGDVNSVVQLGRNNLGTTSQTLTIAIAAVNANKKGWAALNWIEVR